MNEQNTDGRIGPRLLTWSVWIIALFSLAAWCWFAYSTATAERNTAEAIPGVIKVQQTLFGRVQAVQLAQVTDAEVVQLSAADLPELRIVYVTNSRLTDQGIAALCGMSELYELNLSATSFPAASVGEFVRLKELRKLTLTDCGVPAATIRELQDKMPRTTITD